MYNSIILSSCMFGSIYLLSQSLEFINRSQLENKQLSYKLILINGLTVILSGSVIIYGLKYLMV